MKTIGIVTSGGDAPGMNAAIRGVGDRGRGEPDDYGGLLRDSVVLRPEVDA